MRERKVLMLGTDRSTKGGISAVIQDYDDYGIFDKFNVKYVATHKEGSRWTKFAFFLTQLPEIISGILSADIVHAHAAQDWSYRRLSAVLFLAVILRKKTIMHIHGDHFDDYFNLCSEIEKRWIRYSFRLFDCVIALSGVWQHKFFDIEPSGNYVVLKNGVDVSRFEVQQRCLGAEPVFLFLGELCERKGVYDLLEAVSMLDDVRFRVVIAGNGDVENVRNLVVQKGLESSVEIPGWIGLEEKLRLLNEADVYLLPSYSEGLPVSVLEAISSGLPVISTNVGGIPEAVVNGINGYIVEPGNPAFLAETMKKAISDKTAWAKMSLASRRLAEREFSLATVEAGMRSIYEGIAAS